MVVYDEVGMRAANTNHNETMSIETTRSKFEKWARDKVVSLEIDEEGGEYFWLETQLAWESWQAARKEMTAITEQRDGLRSAVDCASDLLAAITEQRDRLTEALQRVRDGYGGQVTDPDCGCEDCEFLRPVDAALQSLTPNKQ